MEGKDNTHMDSTALQFSQYDDLFGDMFSETKTDKNEQVAITKQEEQALVKENKAENISNISVDTAVKKLQDISIELNNEFVEREELINLMVLSLVTNSNLLMLGKPGTAKSKISMALCNRIDNSKFFQWLLNKSSDPAELLGTFSIKGMEMDQFKRVTDGKLPEANIAFIDEIYKCNSPTLNALLSIMNEHIFYNDGKIEDVPLISMFAASNEPPEDESLLAMHDRFLFRIYVEPVHDASNKKRMFNNYIYERAGISPNMSHTTITIEELEMLQEHARKIPVPKGIINSFISLLNTLLKNETISVSDRRANECIKVMQGSALMHGRTKVGLSDFEALKYVLWEDPKELDAISAHIGKIVNPFDEDFAKYTRNFNEIKEQIDQAGSSKEKAQAFFQYQNSLKSLQKRISKLIIEANNNGKDTTEYNKFRDTVSAYSNDLSTEVLGASLGQDIMSANTSSVTVEDRDNDVAYEYSSSDDQAEDVSDSDES